jgi:uncharacterized membrane protein
MILLLVGLLVVVVVGMARHPLGQAVSGFVRWVSDWRTGAVFLGSLLVGAVIALVIISGVTAQDALEAREQTAKTASRRINQLLDELRQLSNDQAAAAEANGQRIGELTAQIGALQEQVGDLGGRPVVPVTSTTTTTSTARPPSTTTTTQPRPTTTTSTTTPSRRCLVRAVCVDS